jgi:serine/threonine protein kinase
MALSRGRIHEGAETPHTWERAAIDFVLEELPDLDPFQTWPLQELSDPGSGRLYEIDLLVLGRRALYLIEIKSWPGRVSGDVRDWRVSYQGRERYLENPYFLTNAKAKVLASALKRKLSYPDDQLWVEPLVFLSHEHVDVQPLDEAARSHIVTRGNVIRALTHDEYPGSTALTRRHPVNRRQMAAVVRALHDLGVRPSQARRRIGEYELKELFHEGDGYQEHRAVHSSMPDRRRRVRSYLVPRATAPERRAQLERAARREAQVLESLGSHRSILGCHDYVENAPLGPALLFEPFDDGIPLESLIRLQPETTFDERMEIIQQIAAALAYCHGRGVLHRNLSPKAVLVRKPEGKPLEVKLHSFQLAAQLEGSHGTIHLTSMSDEVDLIYRAPEVLDDPTLAGPASDVFSLGALACFVLTGRHPATSIVDRERLLQAETRLRLSALSDDFSPLFDDVIGGATDYFPENRLADPVAWYGLLEDAATSPSLDDQPGDADPWNAKHGTELASGFTVQRLLGEGTTAKVFHVTDNDKHFALKVPHDEGCANRLFAEADVLSRLRHQHIVQSHGMRRLGPRDCLLLDLAAPQQWRTGDAITEPRTLGELIRQQGPVALEYAKRFGDDLLSALQYLEEQGVQHKDIKPGNIGFTPDAKQARHLVLFDFSLAPVDPAQITAGTPGYRDPGLRLRGRWDAAADRYAAAVTLYEMLVGLRLEHGPHADGAPRGDDSPLIRGERFDAAVRDRLVDFFSSALHADAEQRFESAESMRHAWLGALTVLARDTSTTADTKAPEVAEVAEVVEPTAAEVEATDPRAADTAQPAPEPDGDPEQPAAQPAKEPLADVSLTTPVEVLSLSASAKNALDRAGIVTVAELIQLPRNHLSAIRGLGQQVAREIQFFAEILRRRKGEQQPAPAFVPDFRGERHELHAGPPLGLSRHEAATLRDAGIHTTVDLAATAPERIERLLSTTRAAKLAELLREHDAADHPRRLDEWVAALFPPPKGGKRLSKTKLATLTLVGLEPLEGFSPGTCPSAAQVAKALELSRPSVSRGLDAARSRWGETAHIQELIDLCETLVERLGGICVFERAAQELARTHGASTGPAPGATLAADDLRHAAAVLRVVAELRDDDGDPESLLLRKVRGTYFLTVEPELFDLARQLGSAADQLAQLRPLPSTDKVQRTLAEAVQHTPLAQLPPERLVRLAAAAGEHACASTRLELYPRGMPAERAADLSAAIFTAGELSPADLRKRVASRYPEAQPLPDRPELDALLERHGLAYDRAHGVYRRPELQPATTVSGTRFFPTVLSTARSNEPPLDTPAANEARAFHDALRVAVERGRFRVLKVRSDLADQAALRLAEELGVEPTSLDAQLYAQIEAKCAALGVDRDNVVRADRLGPDDEGQWQLLGQLVDQAADAMIGELLDDRQTPRLLVAPGALARYELTAQLQRLIERAEHDDGAAVLLVVPSYDTGRPPTINDTLPVPAPLPGQRLEVPRSWLENAHRAGASA